MSCFAPAGRVSLRTAERTRLLRDVRGGGERHRRAVSSHGLLFPPNVSDAVPETNRSPDVLGGEWIVPSYVCGHSGESLAVLPDGTRKGKLCRVRHARGEDMPS